MRVKLQKVSAVFDSWPNRQPLLKMVYELNGESVIVFIYMAFLNTEQFQDFNFEKDDAIRLFYAVLRAEKLGMLKTNFSPAELLNSWRENDAELVDVGHDWLKSVLARDF